MSKTNLKLENVCFSYGTNQVLNNINFEFESGKIYSIVGKSGAGKTTLLSVLSGLATPSSGTIYCNGEDIKKINKYLAKAFKKANKGRIGKKCISAKCSRLVKPFIKNKLAYFCECFFRCVGALNK